LAKLDEVEEDERRDYDEGSGRGERSLKVPKVLVSSKSHLEISEETKMLMKERDIAETRKKRTKCTKDIQYWKRLRNRVVTMVRKANKAAVHDLMEESETPCEAKLVTADALPSKNAVRVEPKVGDDLKAKVVKAAAAQAKKKQAKKTEGRLVGTVDEENPDTSLGIEFLFSDSKLSETEVDA